MRTITTADIDPIALGAAVFGTGGGGDPHIGALAATRMIRLHGEVDVLRTDELSDEDFVAPIGSIGAPSVSVEQIMAEEELETALQALEDAAGRKVTALMPIEIGGGNSMLPIAAAAASRLPIVDADAMGRAFPEAQMVTFHLAGLGPGTTVLVDSHLNVVTARPVDGEWSERLARALTIEMGGSATMIDYAFTGPIVAEHAIPGTLSAAHRIGSILLDSGTADDERIARVCAELGGFVLCTAKIVDVTHRIEGGFTRGTAQLEGIGSDAGRTCTLEFQNEILLAADAAGPMAITPDLIIVLDHSSGRPITTETLRYGARITVLGVPCDHRWRTPVGLQVAGPQHFGYPHAWAPVEDLAAARREGC